MLEDVKLNLFRKNIAGFGYSITYGSPTGYIIQTYLVIGNEGNYKYVKFRKTVLLYDDSLDKLVESLREYGYKPLHEWTSGPKEKNLDKKIALNKKM